MKTVYLIRHAKSSWSDSTLRDVDRPLNPRGLRDAPVMASILLAKEGKVPDLLVSSPANRAFTTATFFAEAFGIEDAKIQVVPKIYEAYTNDIFEVIGGLEETVQTVCIFGHNPTMTSLANMFAGEYIPNVPTCGILKLNSTAEQWTDFSTNNTERVAFHFPKQYS
ncbi:MAG: histidine phosphatase family protein [Saprospiraceae bacterium]